MKISTIIKQRRLDLNLTQEQVADQIFVSTKSISNWENNKNFPDIESLVRLAKLYDLSLDSLLLEGSDIVKDIKKKEKVYELQKINLIGPQLTNVLLMLMLFLPSIFKGFYMSDYMYGLLVLVIASNSITGFYFINKLDKHNLRENGNKTLISIQIVGSILFFVFLGFTTVTNVFF
ncbi:helix-turn-helix transcriptional regulator [Paraclostridium bifermentans]|uniref:helix-turn-helix domain-containing protein n=1 Tax=Paraclostridium bifermentans TaxID=1490 RepID=UPI0029093237|nr:helix-turn-helix transcriptional regulator [Paraclostridium bifermentans]MDU3337914.1 helix-turn-helix transcriptional regulator [Paraclostridium bifermentans]